MLKVHSLSLILLWVTENSASGGGSELISVQIFFGLVSLVLVPKGKSRRDTVLTAYAETKIGFHSRLV